jgi:hypothetical protein
MSPRRPLMSRHELTSVIRSRLSAHPDCQNLKILIAPVANPNATTPNWRVAFTTGSRRVVPSEAWKVGSQVSWEFDLA